MGKQNNKLLNGDYRKYVGKARIKIPVEIDRLEYLISYCLKNYYIKNANRVANGDYVAKWYHEHQLAGQKNGAVRFKNTKYEIKDSTDCGHYDRIRDLENKLDTIKRIADHG